MDDDVAMCHALKVFLNASGYLVRVNHSAEAFLEKTKCTAEGVLLLDQRMTGMSGLELQAELTKRGCHFPIIFISGHGNVPMSVKAIKAGALNFLKKPFSNEDLLASIREAFSYANNATKHRRKIAALRKRLMGLTNREREVMQDVVAGMSNKQVAERLCLSNRTIEVYRSNAMNKMGAESLPDLVRKHEMCQKAGLL